MNQMILFSNKVESLVFNLIGFDTIIIEADDKLALYLKTISIDVKLIAYDAYFKDFFDKYRKEKHNLYPMFLELPLEKGNIGSKILDVKESIKKSIGIDLL